MIGDARTFFTAQNCNRPYVIINGMVEDSFCSKFLTIGDIRMELTSHLRSNGFDAVFFYDPRQVMIMYDAQSSFVFWSNRLPTQEERSRFTLDPNSVTQASVPTSQTNTRSARVSAGFDNYGIADDDDLADETDQGSNIGERIYNPLRTDAGIDMEGVKTHLKDALINESLRCAVVYYNLSMWKNEMTLLDQEILTELDRNRDRRRSIAIFLASSLPGQDMVTVLMEGGNSHWDAFASQHILPGIQSGDGTNPVDFRLLTLGTPGAGEIQNYLTMRRLDSRNPLNIEITQMEEICQELSAKCNEKYTSLRQLDGLILNWMEANGGKVFNLDSINELLGGGRYRTAQQELDSLIGMDSIRKFFHAKMAEQQFSGMEKRYEKDTSRFTPRLPGRKSSSFDMNLLIMGNPGTGKSAVIRLVGKLYREISLLPRGHQVSLDLPTMLSPNFNMSEYFREAIGGVLVIDEAYGLMEDYAGNRVLTSLVDCMSRFAGQLAVILAGYKDRLLELLAVNPGLNSRFPESGRITLEPYTPEQLQQIFLKMAAQRSNVRISPSFEEVLPTLFRNWAEPDRDDWGNAREAENLLTSMISLCAERQFRQSPDRTDLELTEDDIPDPLKSLAVPKAQNLNQAIEDLKNIIGMSNVKRFLMNIVTDVQLHGAGSQVPGSYLFMGPPGTGKTMMAQQIGILLHLLGVIKRPKTVIRQAKELLKPPAKQNRPGMPATISGNGLRAAVNEARGGVLFIDEAHQLASDDSVSGNQTGRGILEELVPIMEDPEFRASTCLILAGYTGPMEEMLKTDQGFASRFPIRNRIRFTNYSAEELVQIMEQFAAKKHEILDESFKKRTLVALSKYLPEVRSDFGNARWIRDQYIPHACAKRDERLLSEFHLNTYEALSEEQLAAIPQSARHTLTGQDIPSFENLDSLAGPLGVEPPPPLTPEAMLDNLFEKDEIKAFALQKAHPDKENAFLDSDNSSGMNFCISGPAGSGRHTAIRAVAQLFANAQLIDSNETSFYDRGSLVAGYIGQTPGQTRAAISNGQGGMIVIVNPSSLIAQNTHGSNDFGMEAVQELANCIADYGSNTCFVLMDSQEGLDVFFKAAPGYRRIFRNQFKLGDLSIEAMQKIFHYQTENSLQFEEDIRDVMDDFIANWVSDRGGLGGAFQNWNNGSEIETLINQLRENWEQAKKEAPEKAKIGTNDAGYSVRIISKDMFPSSARKYLKKRVLAEKEALGKLDEMVGWDRVKYGIHLIQTKLAHARPEDVVPGNYLFIGNPGTGKTEAARLMGSVLRATHALKQGYVIVRTASEMRDQLEDFDKILAMARNNVLFIDEAHQLAADARGQAVMKRLLTVLEDIEVKKNTCIILAGYPREMSYLLQVDPGLRSRFDLEESIVYFDDYTADQLLAIMKNMAVKADQIREIGARCPIDLDASQEFVQDAYKAFKAIVAQNDPNYGNARYVRNFLHNTLNQQILRLAAQYGNENPIPENEFSILRPEDLPHRERELIGSRRDQNSALISSELLFSDPESSYPIDKSNLSSAVAEVGHSVMLVEVDNGSGYGTGFVISSQGHLLTCAHVVDQAKSIRCRMYWPGLPGGDVRWFNCEVLQPIRKDVDLALIKITDGNGFKPLNLRDAANGAQNAEDIMVVGYPFGKLNKVDLSQLIHNHFEGRVSSIQNAGSDNEFCLIDCSGKSGNSGSPVISMTDGRVLGVFDGSETRTNKKLTEEINHFVPIRLFWERFVREGGNTTNV